MRITKYVASCLVFCLLFSCSYRPIFNPNEKYLSSGKEKADQDFEKCRKEAKEYLDQYKVKRAAKQAARNAAVTSVTGAVVGAIYGKTMKSTLIGAAIGAGAGAVMGSISVAGEDKITPDEMQQRYISQCLANQGYSILGWE